MSKNKQFASPRLWKSRLHDMREATEKILSYCQELASGEAFSNDPKTVDACIRNFQVLGDAAKQIPPGIQKELAAIPWAKIKGHAQYPCSRIFWRKLEGTLDDDSKGFTETFERTEFDLCQAWQAKPPMANLSAW